MTPGEKERAFFDHYGRSGKLGDFMKDRRTPEEIHKAFIEVDYSELELRVLVIYAKQ